MLKNTNKNKDLRIAVLLTLILIIMPSFVFAESCDDWFKSLKIDPKDPDCEIKCAVGSVDMGTFNCPMGCKRHCNQQNPKEEKKPLEECDKEGGERPDCCDFKQEVQNNKDTDNQCDLMARTIDEFVSSSSGQSYPVDWTIENLKQVFIGENLTSRRNKGPCVVRNIDGATGFKNDLKDSYNQVQHAAAGIWLGYNYGVLACLAAIVWEKEPQDELLYERTCFLGANLKKDNLSELSGKLRKSIGDDSCQIQEK